MGKKPVQRTHEEAVAIKQAKKEKALAEAQRKTELRNRAKDIMGEEGNYRGGPTTKEEHEKQVAAAERRNSRQSESQPTNVNTNTKDVTGGGKYNSAADQELAKKRKEDHAKEIANQTLKHTNSEKLASDKAAAEQERKKAYHEKLGQTESGKRRLEKVDIHNSERSGNKFVAGLKRLNHSVKEFGRGFKNRLSGATASVGAEFDYIRDIYSEACENYNDYVTIMSLSGEEFDALLESATESDIDTIVHIFEIEDMCNAMDTIIEAVKNGDADSDDIILEACALFAEDDLDDLFSAIVECAN